MSSRVTRRYARALFELAQERRQLDAVEGDLRQIGEIYRQFTEFAKIIDSPVIQVSRKTELLRNLLAGKIHPTTFSFLQLLLEKNRENLLLDIIGHFFRLVDETRGIVRGTLYSAHPLTADQIKEVKKQLDRITGKDVVVAPQQDPSLLAGFIIRLDDWVIDHSMKNQLNKLREKLLINE